MAKFEIEVGKTLEEAMADFAAAWKATERGETPEPVDRIAFVDWGALCSVLTPKRYDLLCHLHGEPAKGVRALARALDRDVKRVHEDVVALAELGLIDRAEDGGLSAPVSEITSVVRFAA